VVNDYYYYYYYYYYYNRFTAPRITTPASHHSVFYRPDALHAAQPTASKHWKVYCGE